MCTCLLHIPWSWMCLQADKTSCKYPSTTHGVILIIHISTHPIKPECTRKKHSKNYNSSNVLVLPQQDRIQKVKPSIFFVSDIVIAHLVDFDTNLTFKAEFQYPIKYTVEHLCDAKFCVTFSYKNVDCKSNLWAMIKIILTFLKETIFCKEKPWKKRELFCCTEYTAIYWALFLTYPN